MGLWFLDLHCLLIGDEGGRRVLVLAKHIGAVRVAFHEVSHRPFAEHEIGIVVMLK